MNRASELSGAKLISVRDVVKDFSGHRALNQVSMEVPEGGVYGLLGPNGAGKTTLLRIINQITAPDQGSVLFEGKPIGQEHRHMIGYLPEERGLYQKMKVGEQALYLAQLKGLSRQESMKRLKMWFRKFEIEAWWDKKVEELSKGMAQKVQFITTVLHEPRLLIFDEPFSGFDPINVKLLKHEILQMKEQGATIIFSTHNMGSVEELCDHISLIDKGQTLIEGEIGEIRSAYKSDTYELVRAYSNSVLDILEEGVQSNEVRKDVPVKLIRQMILGSIEQVCLTGITFDREIDPDALTEDLCDIIFRGIVPASEL